MLAGKRIIVTGSARGIGAAVVRCCARSGAPVVGLDVLEELGQAVAQEATAAGPGAATFRFCDVSDPDSVTAAVDGAVCHLGGLDGLAHVAGIEHSMPAAVMTIEDWERVMAVNARGTMLINQAAFRVMSPRGGGSIVNFASGDGIRGRAGGAHYAASKGAVLAWTRTVAEEWGGSGVRVNALAPTAETPMMREWQERMGPGAEETVRAFFASAIPLGGRPGDPERDIAPVVAFLLSDHARFITGQTIPVDGGYCKVS